MLTIKLTSGELINHADWISIPTTAVIRYMDYKIENQTIRLMGYDSYLRLKEMVHGLNISFKGMTKVFLIGKKGNVCDKVEINLMNGKMTKTTVDYDKVYNGKPIEDRFWRSGQTLENANVYINRG